MGTKRSESKRRNETHWSLIDLDMKRGKNNIIVHFDVNIKKDSRQHTDQFDILQKSIKRFILRSFFYNTKDFTLLLEIKWTQNATEKINYYVNVGRRLIYPFESVSSLWE